MLLSLHFSLMRSGSALRSFEQVIDRRSRVKHFLTCCINTNALTIGIVNGLELTPKDAPEKPWITRMILSSDVSSKVVVWQDSSATSLHGAHI